MKKLEHEILRLLDKGRSREKAEDFTVSKILASISIPCFAQLHRPVTRWACYLVLAATYLQLVSYIYLSKHGSQSQITLSLLKGSDYLAMTHLLCNFPALLMLSGQTLKSSLNYLQGATFLLSLYLVGYFLAHRKQKMHASTHKSTLSDRFFRYWLILLLPALFIPMLQTNLFVLIGYLKEPETSPVAILQIVTSCASTATILALAAFTELQLTFALTLPERNLSHHGHSHQGLLDLFLKLAVMVIFTFNFYFGRGDSFVSLLA